MPADDARFAMPVQVPCMSRTLGIIARQVRSCSSVQRAWISTVQHGVEQPKPCVVIELGPGVSDEQEVVRTIVDPLVAIAAQLVSEEDAGTGTFEEIVRNELLAFAWFVADDRMQA
jgi:hypothetical protein